jgi:hypothetical protein
LPRESQYRVIQCPVKYRSHLTAVGDADINNDHFSNGRSSYLCVSVDQTIFNSYIVTISVEATSVTAILMRTIRVWKFSAGVTEGMTLSLTNVSVTSI